MRDTKRILIALAAITLGACGGGDPGTPDGGPGTDGGPGSDSSPGVDGGPGADGGPSSSGFRAITLPGDDERVTGFYCTAAHTCVVSTDPFAEAGHIYATDGHTITRTLVTGDEAFADALHTVGTVSFLGFSHVGDRLVAHVNDAEDGFVSATGDVTQASSWTSVVIAADPSNFGLNAQFGFGSNAGHWTLMAKGRIWDTTDMPGTSARWTNIYSPQAVPPIPADIEDQRAADPTLCDSDPSITQAWNFAQSLYVAPDLSLIVTPAGGLNQEGNDDAGVCISTDGGHSFHHAGFAGVDVGAGPTGIACTSRDHCVAYGGLESTAGSVYVYVSNDASHGASSHWTRATTPTLSDSTGLRSAAFAPDGTHGWLVGWSDASTPLMLTTTDGGATWTDATPAISALAAGHRLHSVYALDATHVWIGGEHDTLLTTGD
jgi:hypothetical protein